MKRTMGRHERKEVAVSNLREVGRLLELSSEELARRVGVSQRAVQFWLSDTPDTPRPVGRNLLKVEAFVKRCKKLLKKKPVKP